MAGKEIEFKSGDGSSNVGGDLKLTAGLGNGTNKKGGDLIFSTGTSTGNQSAAITLLTSVSGDSGSDDQSPAERMRIHTNGYVGIGSSAPGTLLQLEGTDAYLTLKNTSAENGDGEAETKIIFEDHSNTSLATIQASHDGSSDDTKGDLILSTHNGSGLQEALRIESTQNTLLAGNLTTNDIIFVDDANSSHNLTITANQTGGTNTLTLKVTSNSTVTLAANLGVEATSIINQDVTTDSTPTFASTTLNKADSGGDVTVNFQQGGSTTYTIGIDDTDNKFKIHSHSALQDTSDLTIDSSGNIGIGTASPGSKLHLSSGAGANGDCEITIQTDTDNDGSNESSNPRLVLNQDGGNVKSYFSNGANFLGIYNCAQSNSGIVLGISTEDSSTINSNTSDQNISATAEVMRISNDLKVGIGTTAPSTKLEIKSDITQLRLTDNSDSSKYADINQNDDHFTIKTYGSGSDIVLDAKGNDVQFKGNGTSFGGIAKASNDLILYSNVDDKSIVFKNSVSGSLTQILELNKTNNLATFDSNVKLNGSLINSLSVTNLGSSENTITVNFALSNAGDFEYVLNDSNTTTITLEYAEITDSSLVGKRGYILISRAGGGVSNTLQLGLSTSMSTSRLWRTGVEGTFNTIQFAYHNNKRRTYIYEYYIYSTTRVYLSEVMVSGMNYT